MTDQAGTKRPPVRQHVSTVGYVEGVELIGRVREVGSVPILRIAIGVMIGNLLTAVVGGAAAFVLLILGLTH